MKGGKVGFLGFLKKGKGSSKDESLDIPMLTKAGSDEEGLPSFPEETPEEEDLTLPEIPGLEQEAPEMPQTRPLPDFPSQQEVEAPYPEHDEMPATPQAEPEMEMPELEPPMPRERAPEPEYEYKSDGEPYMHTPVSAPEASPYKPVREEPRAEGLRERPRGDVFISGEDYRSILEGIDLLVLGHREKSTKQERDILRIEERENEKLMRVIEDVQRDLIVTENILFE